MPFSSLNDALRHKLEEYQREYDNAESALKTHEVETHKGLVVPSLNEFRCAGQHMARTVAAKNVDDAVSEADKAIGHLRRAAYDAYDAALSYLIEQCIRFQEDYKDIVVTSVLADYMADSQKMYAINEELGQEDRKNREVYAEKKKEQFIAVKTIFQRWHVSRSELNKIVIKERNKWYLQVIGLILAVATLIAAFVK